MEEVVSGVYRLPLSLQADNQLFSSNASANAYLLRGRDGCLLVDTCWNTDRVRTSMKSQLAELGLGLTDITQVVFTHLHPDHCGLAGWIREFSPAPNAAHLEDIKFFGRQYANTAEETIQQEEHWFNRIGLPVREWKDLEEFTLESIRLVRFVKPETTLEDRDVIDFPPFRLRVVWTPGHAPGHICLYEPRLKLFIAGDHLVEMGTPPIDFSSSYPEDYNPLAMYMNSLRSLEAAFDKDLVLPAHGRPFPDLKSHVRRTMSIMEQKEARVMDLLDGRALTPFEVIRLPNPGKPWEEMHTTEKRRILVDTVSRLQALHLSGRIEQVLKDGVTSFRRLSS